jgi:hypothetical protein
MEVTPISRPAWPVEPVARPEGGATDRSGMERRPAADRPPPTASARSSSPSPQAIGDGAAPAEMEELRFLVSKARLELRLEALPDSSLVRIRIVDPATGQVVREFPSEAISGAIEELRAQETSHLDARG